MKPKRSLTHLIEHTERIYNALEYGVRIGNISRAARENGLTRNQLNYYRRDIKDNRIRQSHGGSRSPSTFTTEQYELLVATVVAMVNVRPNLTMREIAQEINSDQNSIFYKKVNKSRICSIFKELKWNYHSPTYKQENKYKIENLLKLFYFNTIIYNTDWKNIYFLDECSFSSRGFLLGLRRSKAVGPIGEPVYVTNSTSISETYNGFFTISLDDCLYKIRDKTNNTEDFFQYVRELLESGFCKPGSLLVMDNAPIHGGIEALNALFELFNQYSVQLIFLPSYSPELNPIERFFGHIKNHFYRERNSHGSFLDEIIDTIDNSLIKNKELFIGFYRQSLNFWSEKKRNQYQRKR
ncbi:hypothetical protein DDB_G0286157 [Dictyostelium discoideum AX4]|uniref:Tc1-like transposase DDE domain-containing protein n=1 Tax=Dictyostelium discoideum TaxID=44689 RepID=Q54M66_DICDI|nr:hypothetical protein DDB_G0286157 [Dictyostelium discoideum AX4]EAL64371.1 hypothetical protein DDB_G0286157 [Dictyostelium discoideum AX4]|eukprot:XP_637882.1 hypothetical protein DDB_G0286157 [Dictyostelium discoideum AX4]